MSSRSGSRSPPISPVLFLTVDGEPMRFFLRPGPTKVHLQPIIKAGGGLVCRAQEPRAFLLVDPEEMGSVAGSAAHWYVSTQYILDCVEKNQQLEVEDYRFKPDNVQVNVQTRSAKQSVGSGGRMGYTPEEDEAIVRYVCEHKREARGNKVWQEMEKSGLTCHSWQSMKDRYRKQLSHRQPEPQDRRGGKKPEPQDRRGGKKPEPQDRRGGKKTAAASEEKGGNSSEKEREKDISSQPSSLQKDIPPQPSSLQKDIPPQPSSLQKDISPQPSSLQKDISPQPSSLQKDIPPQPSSLQKDIPPQPSSLQKDIPPQPSSLQKDIPPQPDIIIMPLALESNASEYELPHAQSDSGLQLPQMSPQEDQAQCFPEGTGTKEPTVEPERDPSPQPQIEPSTSVKAPAGLAQSDTTTPQQIPSKRPHQLSPPAGKHPHPQPEEAAATPSPKRARSNSGAVAEVLDEMDSAVTSGEKATTSNTTEGQQGKKKANKCKLGILESAVREFEGSDESGDDDETPDLSEIATPPSAPPAPVPGPGRETQSPAAVPQTENSSAQIQPQPAAQEKSSETQPGGQLPEASGPAMSGSVPNTSTVPNALAIPSTTSVTHLFLFERDSQQAEEEELSQPFTQLQFQQSKQLVLSLMKDSKLGLVAVTKALLKNSGDVSAALRDPLMMPNIGGEVPQGPRWERHDDCLLLSADPSELHKKFGEEGVAKRMAFLDAE